MIYITPEQYETAAQNGISRGLLDARVKRLGWPISRAISKPVKRTSQYDVHRRKVKEAEKNGIPKEIFMQRVSSGWSQRKASTTPVKRRKKV